MSIIEATADTLLRQASMTAAEYFDKAILHIDTTFGEGYAKEHPELIAAYMKVSASDMNFMTLSKSLSEGLEALAESLSNALMDSFADKS